MSTLSPVKTLPNLQIPDIVTEQKGKCPDNPNENTHPSLSVSDVREDGDQVRKKPRFTVIPVQINHDRECVRRFPRVASSRSIQREIGENTSLRSFHQFLEANDYDPDITVSLTVPCSQSGRAESYHTLNGVPSSLVSVVLPKCPAGGAPPPRNSSQKSLNPFSRLGIVPHGATIPPLHETTDSQHSNVLNKLLLESEKNIRYGSSDGRRLKVLPSGMSSQVQESGSIRDHSFSFRGQPDFYGNKKNQNLRPCWRTRLEFLVSCVGACLGLGSFWRLPYLCLLYGRGVGVSLLVLSAFTSVYYSFIFSESILSLGLVLGEPLSFCNASRIFLCSKEESTSAGLLNLTDAFLARRDDEEFLGNQTGGHLIEAVTALLLTLTGSWVVVYFALWKSVRSIGKVTKVSATVPFILITAFVWRALTLPGATVGLQHLFTPRWNFLMHGEVWVNAAVQVLISLNVVSGSTVVFSSYNKFSSSNISADVWIISSISCVSSLLAVLVVFSGIGNIADESGFQIGEIDFAGADLELVVYPQILSKMPHKHLWAAMFFLLLLLLGIDSQFASVEVVVTSLNDSMTRIKAKLRFAILKRIFSKNELQVMVVCVTCFLFSLPFVFQGKALFDHTKNFEAMNMAVLFLSMCEVTTLTWVYGIPRMRRNFFEMTSRYPSPFYIYSWKFLTPTVFLLLWITSLVSYQPPGFLDENGNNQTIAVLLGWVTAALCILPVPIFCIVSISKSSNGPTLRQRLMTATSPEAKASNDWDSTAQERLLNSFKCFSKDSSQQIHPTPEQSPRQGLRRNRTSLSV